MEWTPQQSTIYNALDNTDDSFMVVSVAGSGKTSTLTEAINHLRGSIIAVAFNVKNKRALEDKISHAAVCKTMNALGHQALCKYFGRRVEIDASKVRKIVKELLRRGELAWDLFSPTQRLVSRAKHHGLMLKGTPGDWKSLVEDTDGEWEYIALHYDIPFSLQILRLARQTLKISNEMAWKGKCDFDDQIYIPIVWKAAFDQFDNVLVDEAQDLSEIQHEMLARVLRKGGRLLAVGDPSQAIYGWRGAKSDSIDQLTSRFNLKPLNLTVSFRCPKRVVEEARTAVGHIEAAPWAPEGEVVTRSEFDASLFSRGDAILCRNNAPIIKLAYLLIGQNVGVHVVGRDIGSGLKFLIGRLVKGMGSYRFGQGMICLNDELQTWREREIRLASEKEQWYKVSKVDDQASTLLVVMDNSGADTINDLFASIDELFSKDSAPITLSTIHRAKGLEWPRVFFLDSHLIPSIWARKAFERDEERYGWMMQEEQNIRYVAITRAMNTLTYIHSKGWKNGHE